MCVQPYIGKGGVCVCDLTQVSVCGCGSVCVQPYTGMGGVCV